MGKAKYLLGRIKSMDYGQFFDAINTAHKKSGRNKVSLFFDIIGTGLKYQAGYTDYISAGMYNMTPEQKADVITRGVNNSYVVKYNDPAYYHFFNDKADFDTKFADYMKRDWMVVRSEADRDKFMELIQGKDQIVIKPAGGMGGDGVSIQPAEAETFEKCLKMIPCIAEEKIIQVPEMASRNSSSVNTVRALTFLGEEGPHILAAFLRIGRGGDVDNFCSGGMVAPVDLDTGLVTYPAVDGNNDVFSKHPITGESITGFKIPFCDEVKETVLKAATVVPEIRYVGWDVAISTKGVCLIEGNEYPAHAFFSFPAQHPDGKGMRHIFEGIMNGSSSKE